MVYVVIFMVCSDFQCEGTANRSMAEEPVDKKFDIPKHLKAQLENHMALEFIFFLQRHLNQDTYLTHWNHNGSLVCRRPVKSPH